MITLQEIKQNESIKALVRAGNRYLETLGYTDHGPRHLGYVSRTASGILKSLGYSEREVELAAIAGWVHDVGNSVNRHDHGPNGAILLFPLLREIGMDIEDVMIIITAVGNHEEQSGTVSSAVSAALAIADKSDAHKSRVRNGRPDVGDIHDRVNFAIQENSVIVDRKHKIIRQELKMDESSSVLEYLSIYLPRILMCEKAAEFLGQHFELRRSPQLDKIRREQETAHPDSGPQTATPPPSGAAAAECPEGTTPAEAANNPDDRTEREATRDADRDGRE